MLQILRPLKENLSYLQSSKSTSALTVILTLSPRFTPRGSSSTVTSKRAEDGRRNNTANKRRAENHQVLFG